MDTAADKDEAKDQKPIKTLVPARFLQLPRRGAVTASLLYFVQSSSAAGAVAGILSVSIIASRCGSCNPIHLQIKGDQGTTSRKSLNLVSWFFVCAILSLSPGIRGFLTTSLRQNTATRPLAWW